MAQEIDLEVRFRAEELYVDRRLTYEEVAEKVGAAVNTVKRWGKEGDWKRLRAERLEAKRMLRHNLFKLRTEMMQKAAESQDPQQVFAVIRLEKLAADTEPKNSDQQPADIDRPKIFLEDLEFIAEVLKEIDPEGLKVLAHSFDEIVSRFKECHAQTA